MNFKGLLLLSLSIPPQQNKKSNRLFSLKDRPDLYKRYVAQLAAGNICEKIT
jgi:hypothetical protein